MQPLHFFIQICIYKREKCKHFPVLCLRSNDFIVDQRWIHLHWKPQTQHFTGFHSSCELMNLPLLDIMLLMRNMHWAEIQRPIDRPENNPLTFWCDFKDVTHIERIGIMITVSHKSVKTFWWKSVTCHDESVWVAAKRAEVCINDVSSLSAFSVSLTDL